MTSLSCIFADRFVRSVHQEVRTALQSLFDKLQSSMQKHIVEAINAIPEPASIHVMAIWTSIASLGKWLSLDLRTFIRPYNISITLILLPAQQVLVFGQPSARKVASLPSGSEGWTLAASASLSLTWVELSCVADEAKRSRLDVAFASYVLYVARSPESGL